VLDDPLDENLYLIFEGLPGGQLMNWNEQSCSYSAGPAVERSLDSCQNVHWDGASSNPRLQRKSEPPEANQLGSYIYIYIYEREREIDR